MIRRAAVIVAMLTACSAPSDYTTPHTVDGAPPREFVIDEDFTEYERAQIVSAIGEWNAVDIISPHVTYRQIDLHPGQMSDEDCGVDLVYVQKGYPEGEDTSHWGDAGESFWKAPKGSRAIAYIALQNPNVYLHELGHTFGLGHTDDPACVMYGVVTNVRHVTACDYRALCAAWGCDAR